ncbi:MAG: hypothetical protein WCW56_03445 [Candidatus Paceibacterota bacterium]|jgi:hypothetical protein
MSVWRTQRQIIYLTIVVLAIGLIIFGLVWYFFPKPTCTDGKQNQTEEGIDCGGTCPRACVATTLPLRVIWTRVFPERAGRFDVAVEIENQNADRGIERVGYRIRIYDKDGVILAKKENTIYINPLDKFIVFESGFDTGKKIATVAEFEVISQSPWMQSKPIPPAINLERIIEENNFTAPSSTPKLRLRVTNRSLEPLEQVAVSALLLDENQTVYSGSQTIVDRLDKGQTKEVFFTWPEPLAQEPANIDFTWHVNGFEQKITLP